jgi:hypothetical protein
MAAPLFGVADERGPCDFIFFPYYPNRLKLEN